MKTVPLLAFLVPALLVAAFGTPARAQTHFTQCATRTGNNATIVIPSSIQADLDGRAIEAGDEIAVFSGEGTCSGVTTWTGTNVALTAWGDDLFSEQKLGLNEGDPLRFRIWSATIDREYGVVDSVAAGFSSDRPYYNSTGSYVPDGIYILKALVVVPVDKDAGRGEAHSSPKVGRDANGLSDAKL
jgi:hypothetical protein